MGIGHSQNHEITLYGMESSTNTLRVWAYLEEKQLQYKVCLLLDSLFLLC